MVKRGPRHGGRTMVKHFSDKQPRPGHVRVSAQVGPLIKPTRSMIQMDPVALYPTAIKETAFGSQKGSTTRTQARKKQNREELRTLKRSGGDQESRSCEEERRQGASGGGGKTGRSGREAEMSGRRGVEARNRERERERERERDSTLICSTHEHSLPSTQSVLVRRFHTQICAAHQASLLKPTLIRHVRQSHHTSSVRQPDIQKGGPGNREQTWVELRSSSFHDNPGKPATRFLR